MRWDDADDAKDAERRSASMKLSDRSLIPRRLLFGPPDHAVPALSPDGAALAFLAPRDGVAGVWVGPPGGPYAPVTATKGSVAAFRWAEDSRHLLVETDVDGDEDWHLHAVDARTGRSRDLTPFPGVQARFVATSPAVPGAVLGPPVDLPPIACGRS